MTEKDMLVRSYDDIVDPRTAAMIEGVYAYWEGKDLHDIEREMPEPVHVDIGDDRSVQLIEVAPSSFDHDLSRDTVLCLPFLNGYTPHHYIRAKTLQMLTNPNSSVWILPNNGTANQAYRFNTNEAKRLVNGDIRPLGEMYIRAFENLSTTVGTLALSGYSQGGLTTLAMAAVGSDRLTIDRVNADEIPSAADRTAKQLSRDFARSGGWNDLKGAVADAHIQALSEAMSTPRLAKDIAKFGLASLSKEARLLKQAMSGSAHELVEQAINNGVQVKLGSVAASRLFEVESIDVTSSMLTTVQYVGAPFEHRHATGDNVIAHGVMANHGLQL